MSQAAAHVLISQKCVNNCVFCTAIDHRQKGRFAEREVVCAYLDRISKEGVTDIVFSGIGEPTLDPHLDEYLELAQGLGFRHMQLFTNGYGITMELAERWRKRGLTSVLISVHGVAADHDQNVRRKGSFQEAIAAIRIYAGAGVHVSVNTCITRSNLERLDQLGELIQTLPVLRHALSFPEWSGGVLRHPEIIPDYADVAEFAASLANENDSITYFDNIPYCIVQRRTREMNGRRDVRLLQGRSDLQVDPTLRKMWPKACHSRNCPMLTTCPGFEQHYVSRRGWQDIPSRAMRFLNEIERAPFTHARPTRSHSPSYLTTSDSTHLHIYIQATVRCCSACPGSIHTPTDAEGDLNLEAVARFQTQLQRYCEHNRIQWATVHWVGDDPLRLGHQFFTTVFEETKTWRIPFITHTISSPHLRLDAQWIRIFRAFGCKIETLIDPIFNDRWPAQGRSRHELWWDRFLEAYEHGIAMEVVLPLVSDHLHHLIELYAYVRNLQLIGPRPIPILLTPGCERPSASPGNQAIGPISPLNFGRLVAGLATPWLEDGMLFPLYPAGEWLNAAHSPKTPPGKAWRQVLFWSASEETLSESLFGKCLVCTSSRRIRHLTGAIDHLFRGLHVVSNKEIGQNRHFPNSL